LNLAKLYGTVHKSELRTVNDNNMFRVPCFNWMWKMYEGWNFNSGNYLFTTDTK